MSWLVRFAVGGGSGGRAEGLAWVWDEALGTPVGGLTSVGV